jgi:Ca-activated chloride channel family protein
MRFEYRNLLWLLLMAGPALIAFFWWAWRVRQRLIAQFVHGRLLGNLTVGVSRKRQRLRAALLTCAVLLLIVVLARPQWGFTWEEARQKGLDMVVAIDTSRSMIAEDVAPNRLARAKLAALDLKRIARTDRVGLVAFAGSAFLQCPLSFDDEAFRQSVDALDVNIIPQGGSALAEAIDAARGAFKEKSDNYNVLVLFTDGEDNDGRAMEAAKAAAKAGMRIYTIGVGTPNGELLRVTDAKGRSDYVRDEQGNVVKSRLNEPLLRDIAKSTEGFFMLLTGANTMDMLYERGLAPLPKTEQSARRVRRYHERYQWFLGLAMILLLAEMFLPERQRVQRAVTESARPQLARAAAILLLLILPSASSASPAGALKKYQAGSYESAQWEYERLLKSKPDDPRLHFNAGAAAFQGKDYENASRHFNSALLTPDLELQQRAYYNLGNAQYRSGEKAAEPPKKMEEWESAVRSYESAVKLNAADADAKYNLDLVKKKLEELKQQQQQQQKSDQNKDENQENKDEQKQDQQKQDQQKQDQQQQQDQQKKEEQEKQQKEAEEKKKQQEQQQQEQQKKEQEQAKSQEQQKQDQQGDDQKEKQQASMARAIPMTPQEAQRLLDSLKHEEKAMIFIPQIRTNRTDRVLKDW